MVLTINAYKKTLIQVKFQQYLKYSKRGSRDYKFLFRKLPDLKGGFKNADTLVIALAGDLNGFKGTTGIFFTIGLLDGNGSSCFTISEEFVIIFGFLASVSPVLISVSEAEQKKR